MRTIGLLGIALCLIFGCKDDDDSTGINQDERIAVVTEVNAVDTVKLNQLFRLSLVMQTPTPCYEHSRTIIAEQTDSKVFTTFARSNLPEGSFCITTLGYIGAELDISFAKTGEQYLIFNSNSTEQIIDTVFVKN